MRVRVEEEVGCLRNVMLMLMTECARESRIRFAKCSVSVHALSQMSPRRTFRGRAVSRHRRLPSHPATSTPLDHLLPRSFEMSTKTKQQKPAGAKGGRSAIEDVVAREYTIHLHKRVRSV